MTYARDWTRDYYDRQEKDKENSYMKIKFKPVCEKCGKAFPKLEYKKTENGVYISPPVCLECGERITQIEVPNFNVEGFTYEEGELNII